MRAILLVLLLSLVGVAQEQEPAFELHERGVTLASEGRDAEALVCFERALRRAPAAEATRTARAQIRRRLGITRPEGEGLFDRQLGFASNRDILILLVVVELVALLLLTLGRRSNPLFALLGLVLLVLAGFALLRFHDERVAPPDLAIVLEESTALRSEPHQSIPPFATLGPGRRLVVLAGSRHWLRVRRGEDLGWVARESVEILR